MPDTASIPLPNLPSSIPVRQVILIGVGAFLLRIIVFYLASQRLGLSVAEYAHRYDGDSYLRMARAMNGDYSQYNQYVARVFVGYPALVSLVDHLGVSLEAASLLIDWICAGIAASLATQLLQSTQVGIAMAILLPHYLMNSTMAMSESPMLAFALAGMLVSIGPSKLLGPVTGGLLLGYAGLIRPMACFAVIGLLVHFVFRRQIRTAIIVAIVSALTVLAGLIAVQLWLGNALIGIESQIAHAYPRGILGWPMVWIIKRAIHPSIPLSRVFYIAFHIALALAACFLALQQLSRLQSRTRWTLLAAVWLCGNTLFQICIADVWGFECFHRFMTPSLPALFYFLRGILPQRIWGWLVLAGVSATIAVLSP